MITEYKKQLQKIKTIKLEILLIPTNNLYLNKLKKWKHQSCLLLASTLFNKQVSTKLFFPIWLQKIHGIACVL
jgi:hypothetical protein